MDKFEQSMMIKYLIKLLPDIDISTYQFEKFYNKMIKELNLKEKTVPDKYACKNFKSAEKKFRKNFVIELTEKQNKIQYNNDSNEEKKLNLIKKIYRLTNTEYEILLFIALRSLNNSFKSLSSILPDEDEAIELFCSNYLELKQSQYERVLNSFSDKGILSSRRGFSEKIDKKILFILDHNEIKTIKQFKNILLGKPEKSLLKWNNYSFLGKERDTVHKILLAANKNKTKGINILLYGPPGSGKTEFAKLIANNAKITLYTVGNTTKEELTREQRLLDLQSKQSILAAMENSCLLFDEAEDVMNRGFGSNGDASKIFLNTILEQNSVPVFWTTNDIYSVDPAFLRRMTYAVEFKELTDEIRLNIWKNVIRKNKLKIDSKKLMELNSTYEISPALISNAVTTTKLIDGNQDDFENFVESMSILVEKKHNVKKQKSSEIKKYNDKLTNTDLNTKNLTEKIKSCQKLNFSLCLYGEPGTGKSLYARHLAQELGIEVILKRASDLISKYVGETEENIAMAFAEAKEKQAMLIFDEADSFLQSRNNAIRNWEVSQVNEMLTWMESHEYPFVCTTNLLDSLDEASLRRFTFKIKFDYMKPEQVNLAMEHFFNIKNSDLSIKGLTAGDFATVKKKADFLGITDIKEITKMLEEEVKIKRSKTLQNSVGF